MVAVDAGAGRAAPAPAGTGRWGLAHIPALDGLRGAAVAAVLLFHAGHLDGGYLGVDLFFVLSGFLITSLLLGEQRTTGGVDLGAFWVRRARRLLPAAIVVVLAVAVYAQVLARPVDLGRIRGDGLATLFYVANWRTILDGASYWDVALAPSPLQHTWSLAIEEQFYLLWPLAVAGLARWRGGRGGDLARVVGRLALGLAAASAALFVGLHQLGASDTRVYEGTDTRATALLLGVALAAYAPRIRERVPARALEGTGLVAAVALGGLWIGLDGASRALYRGGLPVASVLAVVVLAATSAPRSPVLGRVLSVAPLRGLGLISYGLYLWHWPIYLVIDQRNGRLPLLGDRVLDGAALLGLKVGASLVAALLSYRVVEQPIRRGALKGRAAAGAAVGGIALAAVALVAATTGAVAVPGEGEPVGVTATRAVDGPTVLFVGDSVALSLVTPVLRDPARYGINPLNRAVVGCTPLAADHRIVNFGGQDVDLPLCSTGPRVEGRPAPDAVVLYLGARPNDSIEVDGELVRACDDRYDAALRRAFDEWLPSVAPGGTPVVVPTIPRTGRYAIPVDGADERIACANRVLADAVAAHPGAHLLDMDALICPTATCIEELGGAPLRSDGVHYDDGPGAQRAADWLVARSLELAGLEPG